MSIRYVQPLVLPNGFITSIVDYIGETEQGESRHNHANQQQRVQTCEHGEFLVLFVLLEVVHGVH